MASRSESLCLENYDCYGFDIDHTIARYNLPTLFQDVYDAMTKFLVKNKGYDKDAFSFDRDFCSRGLVLDLELGDFMKLAEDGTVLRASHGTSIMTAEQMRKKFGNDVHWKHFDVLKNSVNNIGDRYRIFDNFFDMPIGVVCAHVIDWIDKQTADKDPKEYDFWRDVVEAIEFVYNPKQYKANDGDFFPKWKEQTGYYVQKCSTPMKDWLKQLRKEDKRLFVITSSLDDFARASLKFILGDNWHSYFDLYLTYAKKPGFFSDDSRPFMKLNDSGKASTVTELRDGEIYLGGNSKQLMQYLAKSLNKSNPKVLFFGDSLRSDIFPAKQFAKWDTVLVLDEIDAYVSNSRPKSDSDSPEQPLKKRKTMASDNSSCLRSDRWGSLFIDDRKEIDVNKIERNKAMEKTHTLWSNMIRTYADVAVPSLDCLTDLPLDFQFRKFNHNHSGTHGFYPNSPSELSEAQSSH